MCDHDEENRFPILSQLLEAARRRRSARLLPWPKKWINFQDACEKWHKSTHEKVPPPRVPARSFCCQG